MGKKTEHIVEIPEQSVIQAAAKGYDEFCGLFQTQPSFLLAEY